MLVLIYYDDLICNVFMATHDYAETLVPSQDLCPSGEHNFRVLSTILIILTAPIVIGVSPLMGNPGGYDAITIIGFDLNSDGK